MACKYYVITGGPGAGKTSIIEQLARAGKPCVPEVARQIIQEQTATGGKALPWKDMALYTDLMLQRSISTYREAPVDGIVFFDRGIPDTIAHAILSKQPVSDLMDRAARQYRYHCQVFILPPWPEIYTTDRERKQTLEEAVATYTVLKQAYRQYGYDLAEVPTGSVTERARFILDLINTW